MMNTNLYLKKLVEEIHSATVATIGEDGHPQTRIIDMMLWDDGGIYFLTARGKIFYEQLMQQQFIAVSATKNKIGISLRGKVENIGSKKLDEIFEKNTYMKEIYPGDTRSPLEVFRLYEAQGEYFDISNPSQVVRERIVIGNAKAEQAGYLIGKDCTGCSVCLSVCPQKCIAMCAMQAVIDQKHCLHCGRCAEICPAQVIRKRG